MGFDPEDGIKISLYGRSGSGKSTLWSTFPKPILAVICSGGMKAGELRSIDTKENRKVISTVTLENSNELREIVENLKTAEQEGEQSYATVVLDHATGLQDMILAEILGLDAPLVQNSWGAATQQQYGQLAEQCKTHFRGLLSLNANVVIIAQEKIFNNESGSDMILPTIGSALSPSIASWLNAAVDYICNTFLRNKTEVKKTKINGQEKLVQRSTGEIEYCLRTAPDEIYTTKFRVPRGSPLPKVIVDPTYDKIIKLIRDRVADTSKSV